MSMHQQNILFSQINQASAWIMPVGKLSNVILPNSSPMPPFPVEGSTEAQDLLRKLEEKVKYGEYTAQQAADEYFTEANKMLQGE